MKEDIGKLILRVYLGGFMLVHGIPKLQNLFSGGEIQFPDPIGIGATGSLILTVFAEVLCAAFILIGFKTKWAVIPLFITMVVAAFVIHSADPWGKKEFALLFGLGYLALFFLDSGRYSVDHALRIRKV